MINKERKKKMLECQIFFKYINNIAQFNTLNQINYGWTHSFTRQARRRKRLEYENLEIIKQQKSPNSTGTLTGVSASVNVFYVSVTGIVCFVWHLAL